MDGLVEVVLIGLQTLIVQFLATWFYFQIHFLQKAKDNLPRIETFDGIIL